VGGLLDEGLTPALLWHNPNIHPFMEHKQRKKSAVDFADFYKLPMEIDERYGLREFVTAMGDVDSRCNYCYRSRLQYTAKYAADMGIEAFSTTLLASPYQNFETICRYGADVAKVYGVEFVIRDFRDKYRAGLDVARQMGLYMQKYCGCVFSEEERYTK